jgi:hypothetical protein
VLFVRQVVEAAVTVLRDRAPGPARKHALVDELGRAGAEGREELERASTISASENVPDTLR